MLKYHLFADFHFIMTELLLQIDKIITEAKNFDFWMTLTYSCITKEVNLERVNLCTSPVVCLYDDNI